VDPIYREGIVGDLGTNVTVVAYSREGHHWALGSAAGEVDVRAFTERRFRRPFQTRLGGPVTALQFDLTASRLLTASADRSVRLWDFTAQQPLQTWNLGGPCVAAGFAAGDTQVYAASARGRRSSITWLFRADDGSVVATNHFWGELTGLQLGPDETRLVARSKQRWAELWDAHDLTTLAKTSEHPEPITAAEFSADGLRLLTVDASGSARLWDAHTGEPLTEFWRGPKGILHAAFAPDGIRIGSGDAGPTGTLWDAGCPLPVGWGRDALRRALLRAGSLPALRRAAWLVPRDREVLERLAEATDAQGSAANFQREAAFLRRRAAALK
jgi:WD40 repeat protein